MTAVRLLAMLAAVAGCAQPAPVDVVPPAASIRTTGAAAAHGVPAVIEWRLVARTTTRTIATDDEYVYFADELAGALYRAPRRSTRPFDENAPAPAAVAIARPAPRAIAVSADAIAWISLSGTEVLRMPRAGGASENVRDGGNFTAIAASEREFFVTESAPIGGTLTRIVGRVSTPIASFDDLPRAVAVDGDDVFVEMQRSIARVSRRSGAVTRIANGTGFSHLASDGDSLYVTEPRGESHALVRITKTGTTTTVRDKGVRDGPIAAFGGWVYYLGEEESPSLWRIARTGGLPVLAGRSVALREVTALIADAGAIYVAGRVGPNAVVLEMPTVPVPPVADCPAPWQSPACAR